MESPEIIIIDDDGINNFLTEKIISKVRPDTNTRSFNHASEGMAYLQDKCSVPALKKAILLLDINMPYIDGWDVLEIIRSYPETIKKQFDIYMFTSSLDFGDKQKASDEPLVSGFIEKPLSPRILEAIIMDN